MFNIIVNIQSHVYFATREQKVEKTSCYFVQPYGISQYT